MKKIYSLVIAILGSSTALLAQPTISAAQLNPVIGETISIVQSNWMSPGSGGNNVTWNLSTLSNNTTTSLVISGPTASFPGTNQTHVLTSANGSVSTNYMQISATEQLLYGFDFTYSGVTLSYSYSNSEKLLQFPLSMSTSFTDAYGGTFSLAGIPGTRDGDVTFEVDGYGTVITPSGTYTDVLRVRFENTNTDASAIGTNTSSQVTYLWYKAGIHYPVVYLTENSGQPDLNEGAYFVGSTVSTSELTKDQISVFPNPAEDKITVSMGGAVKSIRLLDQVGRELKFVAPNSTYKSIDISDLNGGVYQLSIELYNGEFVSKSIIKK